MHKSRLGTVIFDCSSDDLGDHARFWGQALGLKPESGDVPNNPRYLRLEGAPNDPKVLLQKVDHHSRVHIDIETDDIEAEVKRLEDLGATVANRTEKWTVMAAPSGHRFCIIGPIRPDFEENANLWE
jgi:predicted enzyme related to lactoylglutathione lyase